MNLGNCEAVAVAEGVEGDILKVIAALQHSSAANVQKAKTPPFATLADQIMKGMNQESMQAPLTPPPRSARRISSSKA